MHRRLFCLLPAVAIAVAATGSAQAQTSAEWNTVIEAAKKEGKVVLYTGLIGSPSTKTVAKEFEKKYGIKVESLDLRISEIRERIRAELTAGRHIADVLNTSYNVTTSMERKEGAVQKLPPFPDRARIVPSAKLDNPSGTQVPIFDLKYGILINTKLVKPGEEPTSWKDLLNPKWKGKILSDDYRAIGGGYNAFVAWHDKIGVEFLKGLAEQKPSFTRNQREAERRVARGEYPIYIPFLFSNYKALKGLPVKAIVPAEGSPFVQYVASMIKGAPHPNAAILLINFMLSDEAQAAYAAEGLGPVVAGIAEKGPADLRPYVGAKGLGTMDWRREKELLDLSKKIFN
jgi:iron(III) transport system substrate-binding protein